MWRSTPDRNSCGDDMTTHRFDVKDPSEKVTLTFDFSAGLGSAETLSGAPVATVSMAFGTDLAPSSILNGSAAIDPTLKLVFVPVQAGITDCDYVVKVVVPTSNASKVLALSAILPVRA